MKTLILMLGLLSYSSFAQHKHGPPQPLTKKEFKAAQKAAQLKQGLDPYLKVCMFYTDKMMIDCPNGLYIRSDLISDSKLEPFFKLKVHMEKLNDLKEKQLKKMDYADSDLAQCMFYNDRMMIDCPQGIYVRNDLVKDEKIIQFIKNKKASDSNGGGSPSEKDTNKD